MSGFDASLLERFLVGGFLAVSAVGVAFGPELRRLLIRLRDRRPGERPLGAEPTAS